MDTRKNSRRSDDVAALLLERVTTGRLRPGDRLPPERELAEDLGVSRTVVREAVSMLAGKGVLLSLVGSGLRITAVDSARASESLGLYLTGNEFAYQDIHEVRELVEVQVAGLAAQRANNSDITALDDACAQLGADGVDLQTHTLADLAFHRHLAAAAGNEIYSVMLDSLHKGLIAVRRHNLVSRDARQAACRSHRAILDAVRLQDHTLARRHMADHLSEVLGYWRDA